MSMINILHISDLHYSHDNTEQKEFITTFLQDIESNSWKNLCKFVVFSGDIVASPTKENFAGVKEFFIMPLLNILDLPTDKFFLVPGNHECDIESVEIGGDQYEQFVKNLTEYYKSKKAGVKGSESCKKKVEAHLNHKFDQYKSFQDSLYSSEGTDDVEHFIDDYNSAHIYHYSNNKIGIACINSAMTCFGNSKEESGKIYIGEDQIDGLYQKIKDCHIRIAVFHHPLDGTVIYSRDEVRNSLYEKFHIILSGHNHTERVYSLKQNNSNVFYNISSCLYSNDYKKETIYDPSYSFISIDCDELSGIAVFRKYYAGRKKFDSDLRLYDNAQCKFKLERIDHDLKKSHRGALTNLHKPMFEQKNNISSSPTGEFAGFNANYAGKIIRNVDFQHVDFSMYDLRGTQFKGCTFESCLFANTILIDAIFSHCHFVDIKFVSIDHFYAVEYSDAGNLIAVAGEGGVAVILKIEKKRNKYQFSQALYLYGVEGKILSMAWRNCGKYIAAADSAGYLYIWNIDSQEPLFKKQIGSVPVYCVTWSPNGKYVTSSDESGFKLYIYQFVIDGNGQLNNITTLYNHDSFSRHFRQILTCAWSPNSKWIATAGIDGNICIWDVTKINNSNHLTSLKCSKHKIHDDYIRKIVWNETSNEFLTCSDDGTVKRWEFSDIGSGAIISKCSITVKPNEANNEVLSLAWYSSECAIVGLRDDDYGLISKLDSDPIVTRIEKAHKSRVWDVTVDRKRSLVFTIGAGQITAWELSAETNMMVQRCTFESKLLCNGMKMIGCDGLDGGEYKVLKNKDFSEVYETGSLMDYLFTKGATVYPQSL